MNLPTKRDPRYFTEFVYKTAKHDRREDLKWIESQIPGPGDYAAGLAGAARSRNLELFEYFLERVEVTAERRLRSLLFRRAIIKSIQSCNLDLYTRLHDKVDLSQDAYYELIGAAKSGLTSVIAIFIDSKIGGVFTLSHYEVFCQRATVDEYLKLCKIVDLEQFHSLIFFGLRGSILGQNMELREHLLQFGKGSLLKGDLDRLLNEAIIHGQLEDALRLYSSGARVNNETLKLAKDFNQEEIVELLG